jgi:hypothetical protein
MVEQRTPLALPSGRSIGGPRIEHKSFPLSALHPLLEPGGTGPLSKGVSKAHPDSFRRWMADTVFGLTYEPAAGR